MLDDLNVIHERDPADVLGIVTRQGKQLLHDFQLEPKQVEISNIVYCGMGGSALAALVSASWPGFKLPFTVVRDYSLPAYVSPASLVILSSYSGNTEETLSAASETEQKGAQVYAIASGGKLADLAKEKGWSLLIVPKAEQPRYAVLSNLKALVSILVAIGLDDQAETDTKLQAAADLLDSVAMRWQSTVPTVDNLAKQIAQEAAGKSVVIYSGPLMAPAAYKWKIGFNENAKQLAWWNTLSEFNHNEITGWTEQPPIKPYLIVELRSQLEHPRIQKRFEVTDRLLSGKRPEPIVVNAEGTNIIEQVLFCSMLGDFVSTYSAILSGINPAPVDLQEKFKQVLDQ